MSIGLELSGSIEEVMQGLEAKGVKFARLSEGKYPGS